MADEEDDDAWRRSPATEPGYGAGKEPGNKGRTYPPTFLEGEDILALMGALERGSAGIRDRALVAVLYRSGIGIYEAQALTLSDLDQEAGTIRIDRGNEYRKRTIGMDAGGWLELNHWLVERRALGVPGDNVFTVVQRRNGKRLGTAIGGPQVRTSFKRAAVKANVGRVHPQGFRHTLAAELILEGWPLPHIQTHLGITTLTGVQSLLDHLNIRRPDDDEVAGVIRERVWDPKLDAIPVPKRRRVPKPRQKKKPPSSAP